MEGGDNIQKDMMSKNDIDTNPDAGAIVDQPKIQGETFDGHTLADLHVNAEKDTDEVTEGHQEEVDNLALVREFGAHPLMERIQVALQKQLEKTYTRQKEQVRLKDEEVKRIDSTREDVGVELYGQQQLLAKLQLSLEKLHETYSSVATNRLNTEKELADVKVDHTNSKTELQEEQKLLLKNKQELDALNETIFQVNKYNDEMKNEIAITRRAAYKIEEDLNTLEDKKKGQDLFIDNLNNQIKATKESLALYDAQLNVQKKETEEADMVLKETAKEMEVLAFEKKQLLLQWKSSQIALERREEALGTANIAVRDAEVAAKDYDMEIEGLKRDIVKQQGKNEVVVGCFDRLESEMQFIEASLKKLTQDKENLAEKYAILERSREQTKEEELKIDAKMKGLRKDIESATQNIQTVTRERHQIEEKIVMHRNTQGTVSKAVKNLVKSTQKVLQAVHGKEIEIANTENEISRVEVDKLNTESHVVELKKVLKELEDDLKSKDKEIEKYEVEIRQGNDSIEKKMIKVDRLNKKYEQMMDGVEEPESAGPLEATIKHLTKDRDNLEAESLDLQKTWLRDQTKLVDTISASEQRLEEINILRAKSMILNEQSIRLMGDLHTTTAKRRALEGKIAVLHKDLSRLNSLIDLNSKRCAEVEHDNIVAETDFVEELKELEEKSKVNEDKLSELKKSKAKVLEEILETEKQFMLWEKKIELEQDTQKALDPEAGMAECKKMEKEIHRMELRKNTLNREKENLLVEMERAIHKNEAITIKHHKAPSGGGDLDRKKKGNGKGKKEKNEMTIVGLKKKALNLQKQINKTTKDSQIYAQNIITKEKELSTLTEGLEFETNKIKEMEEKRESLLEDHNNFLYEIHRNEEKVSRKKLLGLLYEEAASMDTADEEAWTPPNLIDEKYSETVQIFEKIQQILMEAQKDAESSFDKDIKDDLGRIIAMGQDIVDEIELIG